jgi:Cu2+-exporting ATPase
MKTSTVEVGELISSLSAAGVQRQIAGLPGVHHVDVNYVAGSATVHYDETKISLEDIRRRVIECGYHCRGEMLPTHVCPPEGHSEACTDTLATQTTPFTAPMAGMRFTITARMPPQQRPSRPPVNAKAPPACAHKRNTRRMPATAVKVRTR